MTFQIACFAPFAMLGLSAESKAAHINPGAGFAMGAFAAWAGTLFVSMALDVPKEIRARRARSLEKSSLGSQQPSERRGGLRLWRR